MNKRTSVISKFLHLDISFGVKKETGHILITSSLNIECLKSQCFYRQIAEILSFYGTKDNIISEELIHTMIIMIMKITILIEDFTFIFSEYHILIGEMCILIIICEVVTQHLNETWQKYW